MLVAGVANAQAPTNTYQGNSIRPLASPVNPNAAPGDVSGASKGTYSTSYSDYSQDSYVSQAGNGNYATVDQVNNGGGTGQGSTAILNQNGDNNKASQSQSATGAAQGFSSSYYTGNYRNFVRSTQNGSGSQTQQTQTSGQANVATILQGANTTGNRAIQTQGIDGGGPSSENQAVINQTRFSGRSGGGSGNRAEQVQTGLLQSARIDQESSSSYAKQTQKGGGNTPIGVNGNDAYIHQGDPGSANTAEQSQNGFRNVAQIQQSVGSSASNNYAMQTQNGDRNQADITQQSDRNYAEQMQTGTSNYSSMTQSNVRSAAYSVQSGTANTAIITQR